jgi:hypothetical protein
VDEETVNISTDRKEVPLPCGPQQKCKNQNNNNNKLKSKKVWIVTQVVE